MIPLRKVKDNKGQKQAIRSKNIGGSKKREKNAPKEGVKIGRKMYDVEMEDEVEEEDLSRW